MLPKPGNCVSKGIRGLNLPISNNILFFPSSCSAFPFINYITKNFHVTSAGRYVHGQQPFAGWKMGCTEVQPPPPSSTHLAPKCYLFPPPEMKHNPLLPSLQASAEQRPRVFFGFAIAFSLLEKMSSWTES